MKSQVTGAFRQIHPGWKTHNQLAADKVADASKAADKVADASKAADKVADASKTADKVADASKTADKAIDASKTADKAVDASKTADKAVDASKTADKAIEGVGGKGKSDPSEFSGPWVEEATNIQRGGAITQCASGSCVSAAGEMLTEGAITESKLLGKLGEWSNPGELASELNRLQGAGTWKSGYFATPEDALSIAQRGRMGAVLQVPGGSGHMVTIEPLKSGTFLVKDPSPGVSYEVTGTWIQKFVSGGVWR